MGDGNVLLVLLMKMRVDMPSYGYALITTHSSPPLSPLHPILLNIINSRSSNLEAQLEIRTMISSRNALRWTQCTVLEYEWKCNARMKCRHRDNMFRVRKATLMPEFKKVEPLEVQNCYTSSPTWSDLSSNRSGPITSQNLPLAGFLGRLLQINAPKCGSHC